MSRGIEQIESYKEGMLEIQKQFPNCKAVASVLRNLYTVEDGDWMGIYLKDGKFYETRFVKYTALRQSEPVMHLARD